jgi:hypothetical protein
MCGLRPATGGDGGGLGATGEGGGVGCGFMLPEI